MYMAIQLQKDSQWLGWHHGPHRRLISVAVTHTLHFITYIHPSC